MMALDLFFHHEKIYSSIDSSLVVSVRYFALLLVADATDDRNFVACWAITTKAVLKNTTPSTCYRASTWQNMTVSSDLR